jgi:hypothetical protein
MRYRSRKLVAVGAIAALTVLALALAFATGSRAASPNVCNRPSVATTDTDFPKGLTPASCVTELVAPHFIASGADAISVTKFTNESNGGANATHVVLKVDFPSAVNVELVNGLLPGDASIAGCTVSSLAVSCPYGNVASGTVKLVVRFSAPTTMILTGSASYGEGPGNPSNPPNDFQVNYDTLTVGAAGTGGGCFDGTPPPISVSNLGQSTSTSVGTAADTSLPCTFVDAGVLPKSFSNKNGASNTQISFVEFPFLSTDTLGRVQFGMVKILFTPLPSGVNINKLALLEDTSYPLPFATSGFFGTYVTVPACNRDGSIPGVNGTPAQFAIDSIPHANDSCIYNRSTLPKGGGEIDMHVLGSPFDGHYQG